MMCRACYQTLRLISLGARVDVYYCANINCTRYGDLTLVGYTGKEANSASGAGAVQG